MCFTSFEEPKETATETAGREPLEVEWPQDLPGAGGREQAVEPAAEASPAQAEEAAPASAMWDCPVCAASNPITADRCAVCGTTIFTAFGHTPGPDRKKVTEGKDASMAALLSVVPGAGHIYLGLHGEGAGRLVLAVWWAASVVLLTGAPVTVAPIRIILIIGVVALSVASIIDAYRAVISPDEPPILGRKAILYSSLAAVMLLAVGAVLAFIPTTN
jgi:hypothetical protein